MTVDLDDFSLLVDLKGPDDLQKRPAYQSCLDASGEQLAEVLAPYHFDEQYPCGLASCRQPHQWGFLVITANGIETNIGQVCGKNIFGDEFEIKANLQMKRAERKSQFEKLQRILDKKDHYLTRIAELFERRTGAKWAEASLRELKNSIGRRTSLKLHQMATRGETVIEDVREATKEERERHKAMNSAAKPLEYVSEKIGDLHGLGFLSLDPRLALTELKDKLHELAALDVKDLNAKKLKSWVDWAGNIERSFEAVEKSLGEAVNFFSQDNIRLIYHMDAIENRKR